MQRRPGGPVELGERVVVGGYGGADGAEYGGDHGVTVSWGVPVFEAFDGAGWAHAELPYRRQRIVRTHRSGAGALAARRRARGGPPGAPARQNRRRGRVGPPAGLRGRGRPRRLRRGRAPGRGGGGRPPVDRGLQAGDPGQPGPGDRRRRRGGRLARHPAPGPALRVRDRLLRRHRELPGGRERAARARVPPVGLRGVGGGHRRRRGGGGAAPRTPGPGWSSGARAAPGAGSSRCSRRVWAGSWAAAASTGASSPCTTMSRRCATSWTRSRWPGR
ncbi:hypothetical protein GA0115253_102263 [Streptomyces sp. Termitarium-T10T-6]|nr:hypothetical protein GA0115253_102263 [Streptomyces sp. Termitarium-T10T-6]